MVEEITNNNQSKLEVPKRNWMEHMNFLIPLKNLEKTCILLSRLSPEPVTYHILLSQNEHSMPFMFIYLSF